MSTQVLLLFFIYILFIPLSLTRDSWIVLRPRLRIFSSELFLSVLTDERVRLQTRTAMFAVRSLPKFGCFAETVASFPAF